MINAAYFSTNSIICTLNVSPLSNSSLNCHKYRDFQTFKPPFGSPPIVFPKTLITFDAAVVSGTYYSMFSI